MFNRLLYYCVNPGVTSVTVSGTGLSSGAAQIYEDGTWARAGAVPVSGNNTYTAVAQDNLSRSSTASVTVNLPASPSYSYDANGNLLSDGTRNFAYDCENELTAAWVAGSWSNNFVYDGLLRKRIEKDYGWNGSAWLETNETRYVYDGYLVVQERNASNLPQVTYTRGNDLSGSLQGAGGIGGMLARTDMGLWVANQPFASAFYFNDSQGNVVGMFNSNQVQVAQYEYDPFGNMLVKSGPMADANRYRFSSKEWEDGPGFYYYGFRFYDPNLQRWPNRDPIQEWGGWNLYGFAGNDPINLYDPDGNCPAVLAAPLAWGEALGTATAAGTAAVATAAVAGAGAIGYGAGTLIDKYTPVGNIGTAIGNWMTPLGSGGPGRGNPGERGIQREPPNPSKTANRDPQTGPNKKAPAPPTPAPPDPNDPNDQPWWKKPNTPTKDNQPPPPKDFMPPTCSQ